MNLEERIEGFSKLGEVLSNISDKIFLQILKKAEIQNPWFTFKNQQQAINFWIRQLTSESLSSWLAPYNLTKNNKPKNILIIMPGNIPLVGFHDFLSVLISGNNAVIKMSSHDNILLPFIIEELLKVEVNFATKISFLEDVKRKAYDAVIATGNDNSAKYFDYYFKNVRKIIRKNRKSVAILDGEESKEELENLANDVFAYFGLGCRNVSKLFLPKGYDLNNLFEAFFSFRNIIDHKKYANNYNYNKAIFMMGKHELIENGFLLLKEDSSLQSPLAMLHYEFYEELSLVKDFIKENNEQLQCVVSKNDIPFGKTQRPNLWDYADGVDIIEFLTENYS